MLKTNKGLRNFRDEDVGGAAENAVDLKTEALEFKEADLASGVEFDQDVEIALGVRFAATASVELMACLDWSECQAVGRISGKVRGVWVFRGTRVPVEEGFGGVAPA